MEYRRLSHCVYYCDYHLVLVTKYRRKIFNEGIFAYFRDKLEEIRKHYPLIDYQVVNHDQDHIHLLVSIPPMMGVGNAVRIIKANTAKSLKQKFPFLKEVYWGQDSVWSDGYFVSTVGVNEQVIKEYIEQQGQEDAGQAKLVLG
ncbi:IS200/IS605 family transposase [Patescibacteria group bacterium]|nr:IS200/IS605 family transposase [Patescibacteria group bacterium]